jgi:hypothetical protein
MSIIKALEWALNKDPEKRYRPNMMEIARISKSRCQCSFVIKPWGGVTGFGKGRTIQGAIKAAIRDLADNPYYPQEWRTGLLKKLKEKDRQRRTMGVKNQKSPKNT